MNQVVCLSGEAWSKVPSRSQQLMSRLRDAQVLFFDPPSPNYKAPGRQLRPGLTAYALPPDPFSSSAPRFLTQLMGDRQGKLLRKRLDAHRFRKPLLWCSSPQGAKYLDDFPWRGVVYDCGRYWSSYPDQWEDKLTRAADVVFAASPGLQRRLLPLNPNVTLLPNGANYPMFAKDDLPRPRPLRYVQVPLLGHLGTLWPDLDLSPLVELARTHPNWALVLVGKDEGNPLLPELLTYSNVRHLDRVDTVDLPDYLCAFQVCLYLLRQGRQEDDVIPSRLFELLSAGRPIVAMLRPDQVELFPDVIYGAHSTGEFLELCGHALTESDSFALERRRAYGQANSWAARAQAVNQILESIGLLDPGLQESYFS